MKKYVSMNQWESDYASWIKNPNDGILMKSVINRIRNSDIGIKNHIIDFLGKKAMESDILRFGNMVSKLNNTTFIPNQNSSHYFEA